MGVRKNERAPVTANATQFERTLRTIIDVRYS
jgi:hypothetical protein